MRAKVTERLVNELTGKVTEVHYEELIERIKAKAKLYYDKANDSYKLRIDGDISLPKDIAESIFSGLKNDVIKSRE